MDICLHGKIEHRIWIKSPVTEGSTLFVMIHERWSWCSWKLQALLFSLCRAEQEGTRLTAVDMQPFLDFVKRGNLQTEFFSIRTNQCECRTCWLFTAFREPAKLVMSSLSPAISDWWLWFVDLVTSIHENWFCARCVNSTKSGGEGAIVMQMGAYLLVSMYVPCFPTFDSLKSVIMFSNIFLILISFLPNSHRYLNV